MIKNLKKQIQKTEQRKGIFMALSLFALIATAGFLSMSIDLGVVSVTRVRMQNVADAAALAAAQEVSIALDDLSDQLSQGGDVSGEVEDANVYAKQQAKIMAAKIVELNGMYINPETDVEFGQRTLDENTGKAMIEWGVTPFNAVKVTIRKDNADKNAPDAKLDLFFAKMLDEDNVSLEAEATAFIDARDLVVVMDFSGSMNFDSQFRSDTMNSLGQDAIETNLEEIWNDLGSPTYGNMQFENDFVTIPSDTSNNPKVKVTWKSDSIYVDCQHKMKKITLYFADGGSQTITVKKSNSSSNKKKGTFSGTGGNSGELIDYAVVQYKKGNKSYNVDFDFYDYDTLKRGLGLTNASYPYPSGSWNDFLNYCLYDSEPNRAGYRRMFGMMNLVHYWLENKKSHSQTPELYKTRHYPFHAVKEGGSLLCEYLDGLDFGDHLGLATYDTYHRTESVLSSNSWIDASVDISATPITDDYAAIDTIQKHKQAAHYYATTNIGGGLSEAIDLLDDHSRYGAQKTILLMTDGNANTSDSGWTLPNDFDWNELTDFNGDGVADYTTTNTHRLYTFAMVKKAIDKGYTIHTMSVGAGADRTFMQAVAFAGDGIYIDVPGGSTIDEMRDQMTEAFARIAANVPPPKLMNPETAVP